MTHLLSLTLAVLAAVSLASCASGPMKPGDYTIARAAGGSDCQRFAQPGDTQIRIYCKQSSSVWPVAATDPSVLASGYASCRRLAKAAFGPIRTYCATTAQWSEFDTQAIKTGITCRWLGHPAQEVCLDGGQWARAEANNRNRSLTSGRGPGYFGSGSGWTQPSNSSALDATAGSYGPFPAGGAIGQTFH